jgi:hypothetical protein
VTAVRGYLCGRASCVFQVLPAISDVEQIQCVHGHSSTVHRQKLPRRGLRPPQSLWRSSTLTCVLLSSPATRMGRSPCRRYRQGDRGVRLRVFSRRTQMQRPIRHGGGGTPHPMGPPKPRPPNPRPPTPGPPNPRPPKPGPRPPGPPQWTSCACWATLGAVCGVVAASAAPASPIAEKLSVPAIAPIPTILFRVMTIPSSVYCYRPELSRSSYNSKVR